MSTPTDNPSTTISPFMRNQISNALSTHTSSITLKRKCVDDLLSAWMLTPDGAIEKICYAKEAFGTAMSVVRDFCKWREDNEWFFKLAEVEDEEGGSGSGNVQWARVERRRFEAMEREWGEMGEGVKAWLDWRERTAGM